MLKIKIFFLSFFYFFSFFISLTYGQNNISFDNQVDSFLISFEKLRNLKDDLFIYKNAMQLNSKLELFFAQKETFSVDLSKLKKYCSVIVSDDKIVRIITWNISLSSGEFQYFGYIQYYIPKKDKFYFYKLTDNSSEIENPSKVELNNEKWFGCLYYDIITTKHKKNTYYTLLGWDGNNFLSNIKLIEVLSFPKNKVKFGFDFELGNQKFKRLIFEYNKQAVMNLSWNEAEKIIVWDHLSPSEDRFKDIYQYYGPDFTNDALEFSKGKWNFIENIKLNNQKPDKK